MGQAGAQREPSMEEILASIRRIIENNEPEPEGHLADGDEAVSNEDAAGSDYDTDYDVHDIEAQPTEAADGPVAQPVSLADVAARARATPDLQAVPDTQSHDTQSAEKMEAEPAEEFSGGEAHSTDVAAEKLREALTSDEPVAAAQFVAAAQTVAATQTVVVEEDQAVAQPAVAETVHRGDGKPDSGTKHTSGGQLVSMQTGEKVAAAFGELDAAIAAGQQRSFDEIAEEMLRPMLTQWLDDNLPTMVERLVREEIERVSRGGR